MENLITYPVNNVLFDAEDAELFHCTRTSGVFMGTDFTATAGGSDATVTVSEGLAWIRDAKFKGKAAALKSPATLSFTVSDSTYPRYDAITLRYDIGAGKTVIGVRPGSASSNPVKPSPVRSASLYELMLYHVYRPAGSSVITQDNIIDLRNNSDYCGYMVDDVSAFDEGKFLAKDSYDKTDLVANAGGIAAYVQSKAINVINSVNSTSTTDAASANALRMVYDLAKNAIPKSTLGNPNGAARLDDHGQIITSQFPFLAFEDDSKIKSSWLQNDVRTLWFTATPTSGTTDYDYDIKDHMGNSTGYSDILYWYDMYKDIRILLYSSNNGVPYNVLNIVGRMNVNGENCFVFFGYEKIVRVFENGKVLGSSYNIEEH